MSNQQRAINNGSVTKVVCKHLGDVEKGRSDPPSVPTSTRLSASLSKGETKKFSGVSPLLRVRGDLLARFAVMAIAAVLSSCTPSSRLMNFPFDVSGRSLNSPAAEMQPEVAGNYIVFTSDRNGKQNIYLYDISARNPVELPGLNALDFVVSDADISADGRYIALAGSRQGRSDIYLYDRTTRQLRKLTPNLRSQVRNPSISADGKTIAFETSENGQWDIYIYDRTGKAIDVPMMPR